MSKAFQANLSLLGIAAIWGACYVFVKGALGDMPPYTFMALRFAIAFLILVPVYKKRLLTVKKAAFFHGCIIGVILFSGNMFQTLALLYTTPSKAAFINGLYVVIVPITVALLLRKLPTFSVVAGMLISTLGLWFLNGGGFEGYNIGDVYALLGAICNSFYIIAIDKFTNVSDSYVLAVIQIGVAALFGTIGAVALERPSIVFSADVILGLVMMGILGTAIAHLVQTVVQKNTSPTHAALTLLTEPVFAAFFAFLLIRERLGMYEIVGCVLIFIGMIFSELKLKFKRKISMKVEG